MNTLEINKILTRIPATRRLYLGCFASNQLPTGPLKFPCALVVNFDESAKPGTHWVAIFAHSHLHVYYLDSLATNGVENIRKWLNERFLLVTRLVDRLQAPFTTVCGHYAIFFIYMAALGFPIDELRRLLVGVGHRDHFVEDFVRRLSVMYNV